MSIHPQPAWNSEAFRKLLTKAFSDLELRTLCYEYFRVVYDDFTDGMSKGEKVHKLLSYCERQEQIPELLTEVKKRNPRAYTQYLNEIQQAQNIFNQSRGQIESQDSRPKPSQPRQLHDAMMAPVDFVIVAPLKEEREAILNKLPEYRKLPPSEEYTYVHYAAMLPVTFSDSQVSTYNLRIVSPIAMGRVRAASVAKEAIYRWHPRYILLVGIAGGVASEGVRLGDVLIATQIADYELQKQTEQGPDIRWQVYNVAASLLTQAQNFKSWEWQSQILERRPDDALPEQHEGPIASGDKVIAVADILATYKNTWSKLIGVEMEAGGIALIAQEAPSRPEFFMIRSVSDFADNEKGATHVEMWRTYACDIAATYTIAFLENGPVTGQQSSQEADIDDLLAKIHQKYGNKALASLKRLLEQAVIMQVQINQPDNFARLIRWFNHLSAHSIVTGKDEEDFWLFVVLEKHYLWLEGEEMFNYDDRLTPHHLAHILRQKGHQLEGPMLLLAQYYGEWGTESGNANLKAAQECLDKLQSIIDSVVKVVKLYAPLPALLSENLLESEDAENDDLIRSIAKLKQMLQHLPANMMMHGIMTREFRRELEQYYDDLQFFIGNYSEWLFEFAERAEATLS